MLEGFNVSFENIHKILSKCTPDQIMLYQIAINLHRVLGGCLKRRHVYVAPWQCGRVAAGPLGQNYGTLIYKYYK